MSTTTSIEWTDATLNPLRARRRDNGKTGTHCERVSAGCAHCYASTHNGRGLPGGGTRLDYARPSREKVETFLDERMLAQPLRWKAPRRIFLCSLTDLFGEWVTDEQIDRVFAVMALAPRHTFQVLTKRPERMRQYLSDLDERRNRIGDAAGCLLDGDWIWNDGKRWRGAIETLISLCAGIEIDDDGDEHSIAELPLPLPNVWLGVSVEDQASADARIPEMLATPSRVRFVSYEPAIGPVQFRFPSRVQQQGLPWPACAVPDWLIVGGESGPGARPCDVAWIRSAVEQCRAAGVPLFCKQMGARIFDVNTRLSGDEPSDWPEATEVVHGEGSMGYQGAPVKILLRDRKGGDPSEWPADLRVREFPEAVRA